MERLFKKIPFSVFLFFYHLAFVIIAYKYYTDNPGDASKYWYFDKNFSDYFNLGADVVRLLNYTFSHLLKLPFFVGFLLYNLIGFYAIYKLYQFAKKYIRQAEPNDSYLLKLIFLLPNLHFWTSIIGKEPIVFLAIAQIIINLSEKKFYNFNLLFFGVLLILIRPHVALFMLMSITVVYLFNGKLFTFKKLALVLAAFFFSLGLYMMTLSLLDRDPFDISYILSRNEASLIAFERADSYVPMVDYNWIERIFTLNFRPLFFDSYSLFTFILSIENLFSLILFLASLLVIIRYFNKIKWSFYSKFILTFMMISSLFFIQRYSCLGIFVRTKTMYLPFILILTVKILLSYKKIKNTPISII